MKNRQQDRDPSLSVSGEISQAATQRQSEYLDTVHRAKGLGTWRSLYLEILARTPLQGLASIVEIGAGTPDFLVASGAARRLAVDVSDKYRADFERNGVTFVVRDLECEDLSGLGRFDVAVCSDVFEHLLHPEAALNAIHAAVDADGLLFSHVPNEYRLKTTLGIMLGRQEGLYFHSNTSEWTDPHLRRFTDIGYRKFLSQRFRHNVKLTPLRYRGFARMLHRAGLPVPYCLEGGPTYASTNSDETHRRLLSALA